MHAVAYSIVCAKLLTANFTLPVLNSGAKCKHGIPFLKIYPWRNQCCNLSINDQHPRVYIKRLWKTVTSRNSYQLVFPKHLTRRFVLKYVKLLQFGNQASLPSLQGVTHEWTAFALPTISKQKSLPPFVFLEAIRHIRHFLIDKVFKEALCIHKQSYIWNT